MSQALPPDQVKALLRNQAELLANSYRQQLGNGPLGERLEKLVELRRKEGYVADCQAEPGSNAWMLQEYHCSVSRVAEAFPVICDQELQLMRHTFSDCTVDRVHWKLAGQHACGFRICPQA
jgi:DeoR family suf operon transcriptional repressor